MLTHALQPWDKIRCIMGDCIAWLIQWVCYEVSQPWTPWRQSITIIVYGREKRFIGIESLFEHVEEPDVTLAETLPPFSHLEKWSKVQCIDTSWNVNLTLNQIYRLNRYYDEDSNWEVWLLNDLGLQWIYRFSRFRVVSVLISAENLSYQTLEKYNWYLATVYRNISINGVDSSPIHGRIYTYTYEDGNKEIFLLHNDSSWPWIIPPNISTLWFNHAIRLVTQNNIADIGYDIEISIPPTTDEVRTMAAAIDASITPSTTDICVDTTANAATDIWAITTDEVRTISIPSYSCCNADWPTAYSIAPIAKPEFEEWELVEVSNENEYVRRIFMFKDKNGTVFTVLPEDEESYKDNSTFYELEQWKKIRKYFPKKKIEFELTDWEEQMLKEHLEKARANLNTII